MANELPAHAGFGCDEESFPHVYGGKMHARGLRVGLLLVYRGRGELMDLESSRIKFHDSWWVVELRFGNTYVFDTIDLALRFADEAMLRHANLIESGDERQLTKALGPLADKINGQ